MWPSQKMKMNGKEMQKDMSLNLNSVVQAEDILKS